MKHSKLKKTLTMVIALVLVAVCSVGATLAYLTSQTETVTNTFVAGKIIEKPEDFMLKEHKAIAAVDENGKEKGTGYYALDQETLVQENKYTVMPGVNLPKDPFVSVKPAAEAYLFLTVSGSLPNGMHCAIENIWTPLMSGSSNVTHSGNPVYTLAAGKLAPSTDPIVLNILTNKQVVVDGTFVPSTLTSVAGTDTTLSFKAYLVQAADFNSALEAWNGAKADF